MKKPVSARCGHSVKGMQATELNEHIEAKKLSVEIVRQLITQLLTLSTSLKLLPKVVFE